MDPSGRTVSFEEAWRLVLRVGVAAHAYGSTASRLEAFLGYLTRHLGYSGVFRANPSAMLFAMRESPESPQRVEVIATPTPDVELDKLARVGDVLNELKAGTLPVSDVMDRLDAIDRAPPPWGRFASMLGYVLVGLGLAPLLGGGWADAVVASALSLLVFGIVLLSGRLGPTAVEWMPLTTAFVVGFLATVLRAWIPGLNVVLVILSAVAILLPGYTVSLGAGELVAQRVVSGTANLMRGLVCLTQQIAGAWLGIVTAGALVPAGALQPSTHVGGLWVQLLFPPLLVGLCFAFQVSRRDFPWAIAVAGIAYLGILMGSAALGADAGNLVGTIFAVVVANLWARRTGRPTSIVLIPAIVMLVSGTIGFRGLAAMAGGEVLLGAQQFFQMFVVALTIVTGIMLAYTVVRPEPTL